MPSIITLPDLKWNTRVIHHKDVSPFHLANTYFPLVTFPITLDEEIQNIKGELDIFFIILPHSFHRLSIIVDVTFVNVYTFYLGAYDLCVCVCANVFMNVFVL